MSSLSAYAQWKLEEEERFYATFPQARCVSYLPDTYYVGTTNIYCKPDVYTKTLPNLLAGHPAPSTAVPLSKESVLTSALHYDYLSTNIPATASLQQPHTYLHAPPVYNDNFTQPSDARYNAFSAETQILTASKQLVQPHTIVPSQPRPYNVSIVDHLPTPDSARPEASSSPSPPSTSYLITQDSTYQKPSSAGQWEDSTPQIDLDSPQYVQPPFIKSETPPLSHDGQQRQQQTHDSDSHSASHHRHHHPHPIRTITPTSNPYPRPSSSGSQSHSHRGIPLTPLPAGSKKPVLRKPPLACHFCRGRKIACGAPDPNNPDRTCNQCERRSLKCEYPLESRRGMRKKKTPPLSTGSTDGGADESESATAKSSPSSLLSKSKPVKPGRRPKASPS